DRSAAARHLRLRRGARGLGAHRRARGRPGAGRSRLAPRRGRDCRALRRPPGRIHGRGDRGTPGAPPAGGLGRALPAPLPGGLRGRPSARGGRRRGA
ncbi:MAG: hypothetical protein AVDCRST_MAG01-01-1810, partial [uncultured Rubrobacteraceae bacterium]